MEVDLLKRREALPDDGRHEPAALFKKLGVGHHLPALGQRMVRHHLFQRVRLIFVTLPDVRHLFRGRLFPDVDVLRPFEQRVVGGLVDLGLVLRDVLFKVRARKQVVAFKGLLLCFQGRI
jgi:hypothetical protein